jgi:hypothetical protein
MRRAGIFRPNQPRRAHVYFAFDCEFTGPRVDYGTKCGGVDAILAVGYVISAWVPSDDSPSEPMQLVAIEEGCIVDKSLRPAELTADGWRAQWQKMGWHMPTFEKFWLPNLDCLNSLYDNSRNDKSFMAGRGKMARAIRRKINQFEVPGMNLYRNGNELFVPNPRSEGEIYATVETFTFCTDSAGQDQAWLDALLIEKNYAPTYLCKDNSFPRGMRIVHTNEPFWAATGCAPHEFAPHHQPTKNAVIENPYAYIAPAPFCETRAHRHDPTYDCYCLLAMFMFSQRMVKHNQACADALQSIAALTDTKVAYACISALFQPQQQQQATHLPEQQGAPGQ